MTENTAAAPSGAPAAAPAPIAPSPEPGSYTANREKREQMLGAAKAEGEAVYAAKEEAKAAEAKVEEDRQAGLSWDQTYAEATPAQQTLMRKMRADYTQKTQALAQERKSLAAERDALLKSGTLKKIQEDASVELGELNSFDPASVQAHIAREVAKGIAMALAPIEQAHQQETARQGFTAFVEAHPELAKDAPDQTIRKEVMAMLKANAGLDLEPAYWAVVGKRASSLQAQAAARTEAEQKARRAAALQTTAAGTKVGLPAFDGGQKDRRNMKAWDIYQEIAATRR